jgi:hypothetical protein
MCASLIYRVTRFKLSTMNIADALRYVLRPCLRPRRRSLVSQPLPVRRNAQSDSHMGFPTTLFIIIIRPYQQTVSKAYQKRIKSVSTLYQSMAIVRGSRPCDASEVRMSRNRTASGGPTDNKPPSARQCAQYLSKRWCGSGHWLCKSCGCARSESALALLGSERQQRRHGQRSDRAQSIV